MDDIDASIGTPWRIVASQPGLWPRPFLAVNEMALGGLGILEAAVDSRLVDCLIVITGLQFGQAVVLWPLYSQVHLHRDNCKKPYSGK
ncbi:hypothetical protein XM38_024340 [Halomicronema hongdechloris C2206]|uniref:Uncharacterized protein n=2 Tax=Halomicronema hongdechloris TaxID=1209493 RepID=A0A1Z3HME2_9CYAN|nr:hypothetical protein XM38_024340 [Halomicronema hongdechloris C2206]